VGVHGIGIVNAAEIVKVYPHFDALRRLRIWAERKLQEQLGDEATSVDPVEDNNAELSEFKLKHKNIRSSWVFPVNFPDVQVWNAFAQPTVDISAEPFSWGEVDENAIACILGEKAGVSKDKVEEILRPVLRSYKEVNVQRKITDYFNYDVGVVGEVRSKRLKRALDQQ
jgi:hypothetical protein